MTVKEACFIWGIQERRLREKLNIKRRPTLRKEIEDGLVKYFRADGAKKGEWIITTEAMKKWYGDVEKN